MIISARVGWFVNNSNGKKIVNIFKKYYIYTEKIISLCTLKEYLNLNVIVYTFACVFYALIRL